MEEWKPPNFWNGAKRNFCRILMIWNNTSPDTHKNNNFLNILNLSRLFYLTMAHQLFGIWWFKIMELFMQTFSPGFLSVRFPSSLQCNSIWTVRINVFIFPLNNHKITSRNICTCAYTQFCVYLQLDHNFIPWWNSPTKNSHQLNFKLISSTIFMNILGKILQSARLIIIFFLASILDPIYTNQKASLYFNVVGPYYCSLIYQN